MTIIFECPECGRVGDPVDRIDYRCPECPDVEVEVKNVPTSKVLSQIQQELNAYILGLIGGGFNAETYEEFGVNAAQTTYVAKLICWHARAYGSFAADLDGISASVIGHPMDGLMAYTIGDEDAAALDWLDAITEMLTARFDEAFYTQPN